MDNWNFLRTSKAGSEIFAESRAAAQEATRPLMITIVSGIPRSGTSLMMQMMRAGGMPVLTDGLRAADANNPRGYFELEPLKALARDQQAIAQADGKVVKVISSLLPNLPRQFDYRIIFMCRPLSEVVASQNRMLDRLGKEVPQSPTAAVIAAFDAHLRKIKLWLTRQPNMAVLYVEYLRVLQAPEEQAANVCAFLERQLDVAAMAGQVEQSLHREKSAPPSAPVRDFAL